MWDFNQMKPSFGSLLFIVVLTLISSNAFALQFLKDFDGGIHSLEEYTGKGKWTIVMGKGGKIGSLSSKRNHGVGTNRTKPF